MLEAIAAFLLVTHGSLALSGSTAPAAGAELQVRNDRLPGVTATLSLSAPLGQAGPSALSLGVRVEIWHF